MKIEKQKWLSFFSMRFSCLKREISVPVESETMGVRTWD